MFLRGASLGQHSPDARLIFISQVETPGDLRSYFRVNSVASSKLPQEIIQDGDRRTIIELCNSGQYGWYVSCGDVWSIRNSFLIHAHIFGKT